MKKKFYKIAKDLGLEISSYKTYRSDMGCQVYEVVVQYPNEEQLSFEDSYWVGSGEQAKNDLLAMFKFDLTK